MLRSTVYYLRVLIGSSDAFKWDRTNVEKKKMVSSKCEIKVADNYDSQGSQV